MNVPATFLSRQGHPVRTTTALRQLLQSLRSGAAFDHPLEQFELMETHISIVLLTGPFAYKFKKPLKLPFLDFSTLDHRRRACEDEVRLNRRTAPALYVGVVCLKASDAGPAFEGNGPVLEYAVKMVQFAGEARADVALSSGRLHSSHFQAFAKLLGDFHSRARVAGAGSSYGSANSVRAEALANFHALRQSPAAIDASSPSAKLVFALERWTTGALPDIEAAAAIRKSGGRVRECHGDMHLANLVLQDGALTPFDCIEFNEELRWIDTMSDLAFALMDLKAKKRVDLARLLLNAYLEHTGDYGGLGVLKHYEVYRALVRAKVAAIRMAAGASDSAARERLRANLAVAEWIASAPRHPRLLLLHGPSGVGKSWLMQSLVPHADFIGVRSDVERRRLFGTIGTSRDDTTRHTPYTADATRRTYAHMRECAGAIVRAGYPAIVDATFLDRDMRDRFRAFASELNAPFGIIDVVAPVSVMQARIKDRALRNEDASEANVDVLRKQIMVRDPLTRQEKQFTTVVDTARELSAADLAASLLND